MNVMNMNKKVEYSNPNLLEDLWVIIFKKLNTTASVVRLRSVCSLWRSLLPPPPTPHNIYFHHQGLFLIQTKIYSIIQPSPHTTTSSCSNKCSIIKVFQNPKSSKFHLLDVFTNKRLQIEETTEKVLNLMNFRVVELFEQHTPSHYDEKNGFSCSPNYVGKVIVFSSVGRCMVFVLNNDKELIVSIIGEKNSIVLKNNDGENNYFDDIIHYKGQVYVVDNMGTIFWINALSLKLFQFSPKNMYYCAENRHIRVKSNINKKQLVEYDGSLYVVDMYINDERYYKKGYFLKAVLLEVYKLDQEWGKWLEVKDLGDVAFVLGKDSNFALLTQDYDGCEGNCIYFYIESKVSCFNLKNSECKPVDNFSSFPTLFRHVAS